jgi:hypothetical protein
MKAWDAAQSELIVLKLCVAVLLEFVARSGPDPAARLAALHSRVTADIAQIPLFDASAERQRVLRDRAIERADSLFASVTACVIRQP